MALSMFTELGNYHHNLTLEHFHHPPEEILYPLAVPSHSSNHPSPRQPLIYFLSLQICLFWTFHIHRIIQYVVLSDGPRMFLKFFYVI